jgi:hypothetical protein
MASMTVNGIDGLILSMDQVSKLTLTDKQSILSAGADVVVRAHKKMIDTLFKKHTGRLLASIQSFWKISDGGYFLIYPYGEHHKYHERLKVKSYKRSKHGRTYTTGGKLRDVEAGEVGYILEVGSLKRGIRPFRWMERANIQAADDVVSAEGSQWDSYLKNRGL